MAYNNERKGFETVDGNLIRVSGNENVRIDIYKGDERQKGGHTRDSINIDTNTGKGTIDSHNEDKSVKTSTDISCYLTTACMKYMGESFDDNCEELTILRWFRDNFVSLEDKNHYYEIAPSIVEAINNIENNVSIYKYIYQNVIKSCVEAIKKGDYSFAYNRYKNSVLSLEEQLSKSNKAKVLNLKLNN